MDQDYVTVYGKKYCVKDGTLDLSDRKIKRIQDIIGLDTLTNLTTLDLSYNQITGISGLKTLTNLTTLDLSYNQITGISGLKTLTNLTELYLNNNQITEIKGVETLTNLIDLDLDNNQIEARILTEIKSLSYESFAQQCVQYCLRIFQIENEIQDNPLRKFEKIIKISQKVKIATVAKSLDLSMDDLFEKLLVWGEKLPFKIFEEYIVVENLSLFIESLDGQFTEWDQERKK